MKKEISIRIDRDIADQAEDIFNSIGLDSEMALTMFLRRTVVEGKIPFSMEPAAKKSNISKNIPSLAPDIPRLMRSLGIEREDEFQNAIATLLEAEPAKRSRGMSEEGMQAIWSEFLRAGGKDSVHPELRHASHMVHAKVGMNPNTALMRLTFLHNLVNGRPNSTNLAVKYLRVFMDYIKEDLGPLGQIHAIRSLEESLEIWRNKPSLGNYAIEVEEYLKELSSSL